MNNLRVDVIDIDTERRSTSPVSMRFLARTAYVVVGAVLLLFATGFILSVRQAECRKNAVLKDWNDIEPKMAKGKAQSKATRRNKAILEEISGWHNCRLSWRRQLAELQRIVPAKIQLTKLSVNDFMETGQTHTERKFSMTLAGRARGNRPVQDVKAFTKKLGREEFFSKVIESVAVVPGSFIRDPSPDAKSHHRLFTLKIDYRSRKFSNETAKG